MARNYVSGELAAGIMYGHACTKTIVFTIYVCMCTPHCPCKYMSILEIMRRECTIQREC